MKATVREGETVDEVCWRVLGRTQAVTEQVLARNPGLADRGAALPGGLEIDLPEPAQAAPARRETVKLWD
ncbi:tail protein X [Pelagerythrobacter sp.]|uniref:tail protein X n=1 Tax=Pelagerythrobacter sp. TaxID=2800702 RepID=UPI0035B0B906